jgi:hypothetical protein
VDRRRAGFGSQVSEIHFTTEIEGLCEYGALNFVCEDLPRHGLLLVPPSSQDYDRLLADIQRRANSPVEGSPPFPERFRPRIIPEDRPTSAILLNRSTKAVVGLHAVWRFETETGRVFRHSRGMLSANGVLLPFDRRNESAMKLHAYWNTILPSSKRYLGESGMVGDNTDVRPPAPDEEWRGGIVAGGGRGGSSSREPIRQVTLVIDGVFFVDGEFVGPDAEKMFEQTVADAEAHQIVARIAKDGHDRGLSVAEILAEIENTTGVAPDRPPMPPNLRNPGATHEDFRAGALQSIAYHFGMRRKLAQASNDDQNVFAIISWNDVVLPKFRKTA